MKQDPDTGDVRLERDEDVVRCLVDVKENADWLTDVERAIASQRKPSQRLERLKDQAEETKVPGLHKSPTSSLIKSDFVVVVVVFLDFVVVVVVMFPDFVVVVVFPDFVVVVVVVFPC